MVLEKMVADTTIKAMRKLRVCNHSITDFNAMEGLVMKYMHALLILFFSTAALSEDTLEKEAPEEDKSYLCSAEFSTGYDYKNGRWIRERFTPDDKYLVKLTGTKGSVYEYEIEYEHDLCESVSDEVLRCAVEGDFIMNMKTMKFSVTFTDPYIHSTRSNRDSVVLTLGKCVAM